IETFEPPTIYGDFLDLGCGYGPVGITLAKAYPERNITMVDINERALMLARNNAINNGVEHAEIFNRQGFDTLKNRSFAASVTKPRIRAGKKGIHSMMENAYN